MKRFIFCVALMLGLCVKSPAPTVNFSSPPFSTDFIINQPGNSIAIRFPGVTNVAYIPGTFGYISNQIVYLGTNNLAGGGGSGITELTGDGTAGPGSGSQAFTLVNIPNNTTMAGSIIAAAIASPSTPASGNGALYVDSTSKNFAMKNDAGAVNHGIKTSAVIAHEWINSIFDNGNTLLSQPAFTDITGVATLAQLPATIGTLTNVFYTNAGPEDTYNIGGTTFLKTNNFSGGGGGSGITALTGDVTASGSGSVAATVKGLNGTLLGSLQSGVMLNTFSTGVPSTVNDWPSLASQLTLLIPQSALGTGSGGAGTKFLADDQTYKTISSGSGTLTTLFGTNAPTPSVGGAGNSIGFIPTNYPTANTFSNQIQGVIRHVSFIDSTNINSGNGNGLAVGDMNGDGSSDIVVGGQSATMVFTNDNSGGTNFPRASTFSQTTVAGGVALADVNADGRLDVIASSRTGKYVNVLTNAGNGTLSQLGGNYTITAGGAPNFISVFPGTMDANSSVDFLEINGSVQPEIYTNDGIGNFSISTNLPSIFSASLDAAVADLNGDGTNDLVFLANYVGSSTGFVTMTNNGVGVFQYWTTNLLNTNPGSGLACAVADFNNDGKNDIAIAQTAPSAQIVVYTNNGTGFGLFSTFVFGVTGTGAKLVASDLNQDEKMDLLATSANSTFNYTVSFTNSGSGFVPAFTNGADAAGVLPTYTAVGDFNGDTWPDFAVYNTANSGGVSVYLNWPNLFVNIINANQVISPNILGGFYSGELTNEMVITNGAFAGNFVRETIVPSASTPLFQINMSIGPEMVFTDSLGAFIAGELNISNGLQGTVLAAGAASGVVGESVTTTVLNTSAVAMTSGTAVDIATLTLGAGDFDICGVVSIQGQAATFSGAVAGIGIAAGTLPATSQQTYGTFVTVATSATNSLVIPLLIVHPTGSTTYHLVGQVSYSAGTAVGGFGNITARRRR